VRLPKIPDRYLQIRISGAKGSCKLVQVRDLDVHATMRECISLAEYHISAAAWRRDWQQEEHAPSFKAGAYFAPCFFTSFRLANPCADGG
jgi:hypothetical protein